MKNLSLLYKIHLRLIQYMVLKIPAAKNAAGIFHGICKIRNKALYYAI